jgi:hypothetical protein
MLFISKAVLILAKHKCIRIPPVRDTEKRFRCEPRPTAKVDSVSGIHGLLVRGPGLEREEPKGNEVQDRKQSEQAPSCVMAGATKKPYDGDEKKKERNE